MYPGDLKRSPDESFISDTIIFVDSAFLEKYSNPKSNEIAFYQDRIEIYNSGQFPEGHTPKEYIQGKAESILRNPLIANTLFLSKDIEKWGSGLKRIYEACKEEGVKVEFREVKTGFKVIFYRKKGLEETRVKTRVKIIELNRENPSITISEIAKETGLTIKGVEWNIAQMKEDNLLKRIGSKKGGRWEIENDK